jgi:hypothetical protein
MTAKQKTANDRTGIVLSSSWLAVDDLFIRRFLGIIMESNRVPSLQDPLSLYALIFYGGAAASSITE